MEFGFSSMMLVLLVIGATIAVSLWLLSLYSPYTSYIELVELNYCGLDAFENRYEVCVELCNHGLTDVCVVELLVNGRPYADAGAEIDPDPKGLVVKPGDCNRLLVRLPKQYYSAGSSVELDIKLSTGGSYKLYVNLP